MIISELLRATEDRTTEQQFTTNHFVPLTDLNRLGRFGVGVKSVLQISDQPQFDPRIESRLGTTAPRREALGEAVRQGLTREPDPVLRQAVERRGVEVAAAWYRERGWSVTVLGKPFDLLVEKQHGSRTVEVKGSRSRVDKVIVTRNEVKNARTATADLVVVDEITWSRDSCGRIVTSGGRLRRWAGWHPTDDDLTPLTFECRLPEGPQQND
ncbi:protein NO VEIN domain-containing protein [Actinomadura decatromicini]|uniref:DUF3883 domain-containing protein n=1 Tax=Actinomadura decatromicini TaxID=2604572 RepID=A0A5D3FAS0_9ACTN|nr:DUF3883 domain-containing protein [Actinomadura decatromicini]TYK45172.1 DUF3883 domain-containing protein [Actinomadura decatromicini]